MNNKVFLVLHNYDYEGSAVNSVHRTLEGAVEAAEKSAKNENFKRAVIANPDVTELTIWYGSCESITVESYDLEE